MVTFLTVTIFIDVVTETTTIFIVVTVMSYILYVYCSNHLRILDYNLLSEQYHNCSLELSNIKSDHLEQITVCENEYFKICSFPQYFVNKCLEYATK